MKSLSGKKIIITGAAGGFGKEFTKQLLEQGAELILTDIQSSVLEKSSSEIKASIPTCKGKILGIIEANLSTKEGCDTVIEQALKLSPEIDVLINNAGLISYGYFHEMPSEKWETLMNVNVMALMRLSHAFMGYFVKQKKGHILNISSVAGFAGTASGAPYSASKFAVRGFGMSLHSEAKQFGIQITNVYPFYSPTPLLSTKPDGSAKVDKTPDFLYSSPQTIVRAAITGLRKNKLHVYPGIISRLIFFAIKFWPITGKLSR